MKYLYKDESQKLNLMKILSYHWYKRIFRFYFFPRSDEAFSFFEKTGQRKKLPFNKILKIVFRKLNYFDTLKKESES